MPRAPTEGMGTAGLQPGLSAMLREFLSARPEDDGAEAGFRDLYTLPAIRDQYQYGAGEPEAIPPDAWTLDAHFLETPERQQNGERTGRYRARAGDLPVVDPEGESRITVPDYAAAIVDTVESTRFVGERFTAGY
jgi:hypothetical protein